MNDIFTLRRGHGPLVVSMPHVGDELGPFAGRMTAEGLRRADTDWHLPQLYNFLEELDATVIHAHYSRYVIDLNRNPEGMSLYPGQSVTELCPLSTFEHDPIYQPGQEPDKAEIKARVAQYWQPYHDALQAEIGRVRQHHGYVLLWDAHSIRSQVPRFFEGRLADFNLGSNDGASCDASFASAVFSKAAVPPYTAVLNGRFKGGYITRHYGVPQSGVHAIQLEKVQETYMEESFPFHFSETRANKVRGPLRAMVETALSWAPPR